MTKKTLPTRERFLEHLTYDASTGYLYWRTDFKYSRGRRAAYRGLRAGGLSERGYRAVRLDGTKYLAHRIVWLLNTGNWPVNQIDHINGDMDDNRFENLREATQSENNQNRLLPRNLGVKRRTTKTKGDHFFSVIRIYENGKSKVKYLGSFPTEEEAQEAYLTAKAKYHPFSARIEEVNDLRKINTDVIVNRNG
jgi:hypothetical protein